MPSLSFEGVFNIFTFEGSEMKERKILCLVDNNCIGGVENSNSG